MTIRKALVGLTLASLFAGVPALAGPASPSSEEGSNMESELAEMRELVEGLKQRVEAQEEQIGYQTERLEAAQRAVREQHEQAVLAGTEEEGWNLRSAVSEFWGGVDVGLSLAGSYAWNFNQPNLGPESIPGVVDPAGLGTTPAGIRGNQGRTGLTYPFRPDHNSFQVDQVWFDIGKTATEESRAGFGFSLLFGNTAAFLGQGSNTPIERAFGDSTSDYYVNQAYVSYLAPVGEGVEFTFGKFGTLIGAEVADTTQNYNITISNLYNFFQPIDHVGMLASTSVGPVTLTAGAINEISLGVSSPDVNQAKSFIGQVGFAQDNVGLNFTVAYGADGQSPTANTGSGRSSNGGELGIFDIVGTFEGEGFEAWVNFDYVWFSDTSADAWGVAVAGRVPLTDELSSALRFEYAQDDTSTLGGTFPNGVLGFGNGTDDSNIYSLTGTLAYELAQNLTLRGEVRWDLVQTDGGGAPREFLTRTGGGSRDQVVALAQVMYAF